MADDSIPRRSFLKGAGAAGAAAASVLTGHSEPAQAQAPETLDYIRRVHASHRIASVCTGGMILAASGILNDGPATTKRESGSWFRICAHRLRVVCEIFAI